MDGKAHAVLSVKDGHFSGVSFAGVREKRLDRAHGASLTTGRAECDPGRS